jgi:hypothetical protein
MNLPGGHGHHDSPAAGSPRHAGGWAVFTPLVFTDGLGWTRITRPQPEARAACLYVSAHIHLMQPALPLRDLDARAEAAIRALENGAASVTVIDDLHRVDRAGLCPPPVAAAP